jgi:hypothetical protein
MHDLLPKELLVDQTLTKVIGPVDRFVGDAIAGICNEAVEYVLGSAVIEALGFDLDRLGGARLGAARLLPLHRRSRPMSNRPEPTR